MKILRSVFPLVLPIAALAACVPVGDDGPDPDPGELCSGELVIAPGESGVIDLEAGGRSRSFRLHVPAGYTGGAPVPLLLAIHGLTMGPIQMANGTGLEEKADAEGFVVAFPDGINNSFDAGDCCGGVATDMEYLRAIVDYVKQEAGVCVDRTRVYATGFSNGGFMSYRLACEASDVFAAVAPVAGDLTIPYAQCADAVERPVPLLHIHGTGDPIVSYDGDGQFSATRGVHDYAEIAGCAATTSPAAQPVSQLDTECVTFDACPGDVEVTFCSAEGGGHCWFGDTTCGTGVPGGQWFVGDNAEGIDATEAVWAFLSRFECPGCGL